MAGSNIHYFHLRLIAKLVERLYDFEETTLPIETDRHKSQHIIKCISQFMYILQIFEKVPELVLVYQDVKEFDISCHLFNAMVSHKIDSSIINQIKQVIEIGSDEILEEI